MAGMHVSMICGEGGCPWGTPWSMVHKRGLLAKYYDYGLVFWSQRVDMSRTASGVWTLYFQHFLHWGVLGMWLVITYMWTAEKISFCTTACFKVYKVSPLTVLSRVARLSQGGEGPCEILAMCDYWQCAVVFDVSLCGSFIQDLPVVSSHMKT